MDPYIGEVRMFGGNFAPVGWALCNGQLLSISGNEALFSLLGTTFGGDGQTTFGVPDLRGRIPIHPSTTHPQGQMGGSETVTLLATQLPAHNHTANAQSEPGTATHPEGALWAQSGANEYAPLAANVAMNPSLIAAAGGSQPHDNMMPYLCVNFIIATEGIYPTQD